MINGTSKESETSDSPTSPSSGDVNIEIGSIDTATLGAADFENKKNLERSVNHSMPTTIVEKNDDLVFK